MTELETLLTNRMIMKRALADYFKQQQQLQTLAEIEAKIAELEAQPPAPAELAPVVYETAEQHKQPRRKS